MTRSCLALLLGVVSAGVLACSDAETPNAHFDAGPLDGGVALSDGGTTAGNRDQSCVRGLCNDTSLVCVDPNRSVAGDESCRLKCDRSDSNDPCGVGSTCGELQGVSYGACLPAGGLDAPCPCDEGFACTRLDASDGGTVTLCKEVCDPNAAPDAGPECPTGERCRRLDGSQIGVCVD